MSLIRSRVFTCCTHQSAPLYCWLCHVPCSKSLMSLIRSRVFTCCCWVHILCLISNVCIFIFCTVSLCLYFYDLQFFYQLLLGLSEAQLSHVCVYYIDKVSNIPDCQTEPYCYRITLCSQLCIAREVALGRCFYGKLFVFVQISYITLWYVGCSDWCMTDNVVTLCCICLLTCLYFTALSWC